MKKTIIRLTESDLHNMIEETAQQLIKEGYYNSHSYEPDVTFVEYIDTPDGEELEVEFTAEYDYQPEEAPSYSDNYPGCAASFTLDDATYCEEDYSPEENEVIHQWMQENWDKMEEDAEDAYDSSMSDYGDYMEGMRDDAADIRGREMRHPELR